MYICLKQNCSRKSAMIEYQDPADFLRKIIRVSFPGARPQSIWVIKKAICSCPVTSSDSVSAVK